MDFCVMTVAILEQTQHHKVNMKDLNSINLAVATAYRQFDVQSFFLYKQFACCTVS